MIAKYKKNKNTRSIKNSAKQEVRQSLIFSILLGLLILAIVAFLLVSNFKISKKRAELNEQREYLEQQLKLLEEKRNQLQSQISESVSEDYLETEARENFNLKKPGEEVVTVLPAEEKQQSKEVQEVKWWNPFTW